VLAAVGRELTGALGQPATVIRLGIGQDGAATRQPASLGGGDVVCLLAA